jgi:hypothetical protein
LRPLLLWSVINIISVWASFFSFEGVMEHYQPLHTLPTPHCTALHICCAALHCPTVHCTTSLQLHFCPTYSTLHYTLHLHTATAATLHAATASHCASGSRPTLRHCCTVLPFTAALLRKPHATRRCCTSCPALVTA